VYFVHIQKETAMSASSLSQIEDSVQRLSLPEQVELMAWLAQTIHRQTLSHHEKMEKELIDMANDPDIQRELTAIQAEFAGTETDGLNGI
jgi:hypothetical protein